MKADVGTAGTNEGGRRGFPLLFSPLSIRDVILRNRIVFQPHFTALGTRDGMPSEDHVAYHAARARGGVGLIVFESQAVHPTGKMSRRFIDAWDPAVIPMYRRITDAVHVHGAKIFGQLTHGGHTSLENPPSLMWAPTQMPEPSSHFSTKAMDLDDIAATIRGFAVSARNAFEGGFDGVEVKVGHDGLLRSFASPFFNHRTDGYGGSFANRMRLSIEVLEAIREATGPAFPIGVRICLQEYTAFGYDLAYGLRMAQALEGSGCVDYFNCDAGSFSSYWMEIPPAAVADGTFRPLNAALKKASRLPVVAFGRIRPPQLGEDMLAAGEADLIGMARQLITDPETPNKLRDGRDEEVRRCIACNDACIYQVGQEKAIRCVHNPAAGRERDLDEHNLAPATPARTVVVVGGGPAGLKVAEIAARRGHRVILLEREDCLGGQVRLAARQPHHGLVLDVVTYLEHAVSTLGVEVRRGVSATPDLVAGLSPDIVVIATGSEPNLPYGADRRDDNDDNGATARQFGLQVLPSIPGLDLPCVLSADRVLASPPPAGSRVLVVDGNGHWEAVGTAEYLADHGCDVTIITAGSLVGADLEGGTRTLFHRRASLKGIALRPYTQLLEIADRGAKVANVFSGPALNDIDGYVLIPGAGEWITPIDWAVPVMGRRSREDLYHACRGAAALQGVHIERVGDCVAPRLIQGIIAEADALARAI